jgi:CTP:molybdopterin cytidylyltransferase MocA
MAKNNIWGIVLAAGASTRMKRQKLLLPFRDTTIIKTVVGTTFSVLHSNIVVVLGANRNEISKEISNFQINFVENQHYSEGMLSSVICGINALPNETMAFMIFLGDQPQITSDVIMKVIEAFKHSGKGIIIPVFQNKRGHPVLIDNKYKSEIKKLDPNKGLRHLMEKFSNDTQEIECGRPEILRDIDTPQDYRFETNKN